MDVVITRLNEYEITVQRVLDTEFDITVQMVKGTGGGGGKTSQVVNDSDVPGATASDALEYLDAYKQPAGSYEETAHKGVANGYASLGADTKVPAAQLPVGTGSSEVAAGNHNHSGVYQPAGSYEVTANKGAANGYAGLGADSKVPAAQLPVGTGSSEVAAGNHNHDSAYDSKGTASSAVGSHESAYEHVAIYQFWKALGTVARSSDTVITYTAATEAIATRMANEIAGKLLKWLAADKVTVKRGFVRNATSAGTTVTINVYGDAFLATDDTAMNISLHERVREYQFFIPGELYADAATDIGIEFMVQTGKDLRVFCCSGYLKTAAAGVGADGQYNIYDDGTAIMTVAPTFGSNSSVVNSVVNNQVVEGGSRLTVRITVAAGATNLPAGLSVIVFFTCDDFFDAV